MTGWADDLGRKIWITKGSRFNAYRRLSKKGQTSIFTISILTFYSLSCSLLPFDEFYPQAVPYVPMATILVSIFILILSLMEFSKGYEVKADRMHRNATDLNELYSKFLMNRESVADLERISSDYHSLIKNCSENHEMCDVKYFKSEHPGEFGLRKKIQIWMIGDVTFNHPVVCLYKTQYFVMIYWSYILLLLLPLVWAGVLFL